MNNFDSSNMLLLIKISMHLKNFQGYEIQDSVKFGIKKQNKKLLSQIFSISNQIISILYFF